MPWSTISPGRVVISMANLMYSAGAFAADFNETHVYNPRWPPHARFHNGQTMTLGLLLATSSTYYLLRPTKSIEAARDSVFTAALIGTFYCLAGCVAILYPGTHWWDPEFAMADSSFHQGHLFGGIVVLVWVGYGLEMRRLGKVKGA